MVRKANPKTDWIRLSNCPGGVGTQPKNKYNFSSYLKKVGDFVETQPLNKEDLDKIFFAAYIWAWRKHCRITTCRVHYAEGIALRIEVISNTRRERQ